MTVAFVRTSAVALLCAVTAACASNPNSPEQTGPVRLTAHVNRSQITPGATATATFRLENGTGQTITLHFNSGCQILPFVARQPAGQVVHPTGGAWMCTAALTEVTLPPNGVAIREVTVVNGPSQGEIVGLSPGDYVFFARIQSREYTLETERVALQVL